MDNLFEAMPFWDALSAEQRSAVRVSLIAYAYEPNALCAMAPRQGLWVIERGGVDVFMQHEDGRRLFLTRLRAGSASRMPVYFTRTGGDYDVEAISLDNTALCVVPDAVYDQLLRQNRDVMAFEHAQQQLFSAQMLSMIGDLAFTDLSARLFKRLTAYSECGSDILMTHEALAGDLGTSREVITRLLKGFEKQGLVKLGRKRICLYAQNSDSKCNMCH